MKNFPAGASDGADHFMSRKAVSADWTGGRNSTWPPEARKDCRTSAVGPEGRGAAQITRAVSEVARVAAFAGSSRVTDWFPNPGGAAESCRYPAASPAAATTTLLTGRFGP